MGFGSGEYTPGPGEIDGDLAVTGNISGSSYTMGAASGSIAGAGSYLGLNSSGLVVLTASSGGATIANDVDNRITTALGDGTLNAEQNLTFDGSDLVLTGTMHITGSDAHLLVLHAKDADNTRELVFRKDGVDAGSVYINSSEHMFFRSETANKDIILRTNSQNPIRIFGTNHRVAIGNKSSANAPLDVNGNTIISGTLSMTDDISLLNDVKVNLGTAADSLIEYDAGISKLAISGSSTGMELKGGGISIDFPGGTVASGSLAGEGSYLGLDSSHNIILTSAAGGGGGTPGGADNQIQFNDGGSFNGNSNLTWDDTNLAADRVILGTTAATLTLHKGELSKLSQIDSGSNKYTTQYNSILGLQGDVISLGGETVVQGGVYFLTSSGGWRIAQADNDATGGSQLLGIALGTNSSTHGMFTRGTVRVTGSSVDDAMVIGAPVYLASGSAGRFQFTTPAATGDIVRRLGYCLDVNGIEDMLILFEPSDTFIEIA